jgi:hypothetical protein
MAMLAQNSGLAGQYFLKGQDQAQKQQQDDQTAAINAIKLRQAQQQATSDIGFQQDWTSYLKNPTIDGLAQIAVKYPTHADAVKEFWSIKDPDVRQSHINVIAPALSALQNNRPDLAISSLQRLRDAAERADQPTNDLDSELEALKSKEPDAVNAVKATLMMHLAAADTDGKFAESLAKAKKAFDDGDPYTLAPGDVRYDGNNQVVARGAPKAPNPYHYTLKDADGIEHEFVDYGQGGEAPGAGGSSPPSGTFDAKQFFHSFVLPHEGGYAAHDANGAPVNMGINQSANPGVDVRNLTKEQAADIFASKYAAKAANLPAPLAAAYADTAFINPTRADQFLQASGGDVSKFLTMRRSWQNNLVANQPAKYGPYAKAWATRNTDLANYVQGLPSGGSAGGPAGSRQLDGAPFANTPTATGDPNLTGEAYLASLPAAMRAKVVAVAEGRTAAPRPGTRYGESLLTAVTAYDPTFDAANAQSRVKTRVDFTSGKSAMAVNALNTAMGHLFHLDDQIADLKNTTAPWFNSLRRGAQNNVVGSASYRTFDQTKQAAASEMRKVFSGSAGGNLTELKEWQESFDSANSPSQLHAAVQNGIELMGSRLSALQDQYATGMGRSDQVPQFLKPSVARTAKLKFGVDLGGDAPAAARTPKLGAVQKGYRYKGGNPANPSSWSKVAG